MVLVVEAGSVVVTATVTIGAAHAALARAVLEQATALASMPLADLSADCGTKLGPHEANLLKELSVMDANGDGLLTLDEMNGYFVVVGAELTEDEFGLVLSELQGQASACHIAKMVAEG